VDEEDVPDPMIDQQLSDDGDESIVDDASLGSDDDGIMDEDDMGFAQDDEMLNEEEEEEDEEEEVSQAGPSKLKSTKHRDLYAPPTLEELDTLSSTSSASFNLQLSALLQSTLLPTTPHSTLKELLTTLHSSINSISPSEPVAPREGIKKVGLPAISPREFLPRKVNWTVGYAKPSEVFVSGSWSVVGGYKKGKGEQGGVDMVLVMPEVG
jgi:U3 small nucleolar RNA-associated protein 22